MNEDILTNVSEKDFKYVYEIAKEIGQQERHFNTLNATYKTLASTWLLAMFAGIGFILTNSIQPKELFIFGIGAAGGIGIILLWLIDLRVYQQLLASCFAEGLKLEKKYEWLPKIRHNMIDSQRSGSVTSNLVWFYVLGTSIPLLISTFGLISFFYKINIWLAVLVAIIAINVVFLILQHLVTTSEEKSLTELIGSKKRKKVLFWVLKIIGTIIFTTIIFTFNYYQSNEMPSKKDLVKLENSELKVNYDYLAPDSSEIRLLVNTQKASLCHCTLPVGKTSLAVKHKTVDEIWYIVEGSGEIWRKYDNNEVLVNLHAGGSINIPSGTHFQFKNIGTVPLKILIATIPSWPGANEAELVSCKW